MRKSKIRNNYLPSCILTNFHNILTFNASNIDPPCLPKLRVHLPCLIDVKFSSAILKKIFSQYTHWKQTSPVARKRQIWSFHCNIFNTFQQGFDAIFDISEKLSRQRTHTVCMYYKNIAKGDIIEFIHFGCFSPLFFCFVTLKVDAVQF